MKYQYPLSLVFKVTTLSSDFTITDSRDSTLFYVRQKMFKILEEVVVCKDSTQTQKLFTIKANKWLDFSATYSFNSAAGQDLGKIARKGWASIFKAHYEIFDAQQAMTHTIREENAWIKVADAIFEGIPVIGLLSGYLFHPAYLVTDKTGRLVARLVKQPSLIGRRFTLESKHAFTTEEEEERVLLSLSMLLMLERSRG
ncbi:hypothetical protein [Tahibacter sp.]|uniref:hypothetical protein n=1 Tax=Tahibacter sp. TaxID=2056211 RepID=UPI0028C3FEDF|nr:hypothetical protein [Tahibacter sp.]